MRGSEVPRGYTLWNVYPADDSPKVSELWVTIYADEGKTGFILVGPTDLMGYCKEKLDLCDSFGCPFKEDFIGWLWELAWLEASAKAIFAFNLVAFECLEIWQGERY